MNFVNLIASYIKGHGQGRPLEAKYADPVSCTPKYLYLSLKEKKLKKDDNYFVEAKRQ